MWFADIICNFTWLESTQGYLGVPRLKQSIPSNADGILTFMCIYGTESELTHARVLINVCTHEDADRLSNESIGYWVAILAVASGITSGRPLRPEIIPGTNSYAVILGEGDEHTTALTITRANDLAPIDFSALANCIANWEPRSCAHLFYIGRFLDASLPLDVRWLNGYRLAEWHFQRNKVGLAANNQWRELLEQFRSDLAPHLRADQSLHGFMEEARALAAHALLDNRPTDHRLAKPGDQIMWSFPVIERIVIHIGNLRELNRGLVVLQPKA
jgi:hypothetical protein